MVPHLLSLLTAAPQSLACPGEHAARSGDATCAEASAAPDPASAARNVELVGDACSWTTGAMAARVLEEGTPWSVVGRLSVAAEPLPSKVAAPYTLGPAGSVRVIANAVLEDMQDAGILANRLEFTGRLLEVNGTTYFVATEVSAARS